MLKNPKHEAFAQEVALGTSAAEAYRKHIASLKTSQATVETNGPALARDAQVSLRIDELRHGIKNAVEKKFNLTKEKWLERLDEAAKSADSTSGQVAALREIGKAVGWYEPEKVEHTGQVGVEVSGLEDVVKKLFQHS